MALENFEAIISANIRDFQRAMRDVDRQIRDTAMGADADIGADISEFMTEMAVVDTMLSELTREHDVDLDVDTSGATRGIRRIRSQIRRLARERVVIPVRAAWKNYQATIGMIATFHRNIQEVIGMTAGGIKIALSPAIVPIIASLVGLLGQLGPLLGVVGGSTFALGTAFATAGIGAAAFGAIATANLSDVIDSSAELNALQEQLDSATTLKERKKILNEIGSIQASLTKEQRAAVKSLNEMKDVWSGITDSLEPQSIEVFTKALNIMKDSMKALTPMFTNVMNAGNNLADSLGKAFKSNEMTKFFDYLNKSAAPMMETTFKAMGNFVMGLLNMFTAFGPLATDTANGFLKMSKSFKDWAAGLSESKKFQAFVDYVNENMPKLRSIFGDAIMGMVNMFAAFAPSSADMMTSLQDMMSRFKEWSSTLSNNKGFQDFINYVKTNGPQVAKLLGNIVKTIIEFGIAFAPMGEFMLKIINGFLEWTQAMLQNHPWIGKVMAAVVVLAGAFIAIVPHIVGFISFITALNAPMGVAQGSMLSMARTFIVKMAQAAASAAVSVARVIAQWVLMGIQATINAARVAAAWLITTGAKMARAVGQMIVTSAIFVAKWVWMGVQAMLQAARMAAAWFIALGPVGWVTAAIIALAVLIIANWEKISEWTKKIWTAVSEFISNAVTVIMGYIEEKFPMIYEIISQYMTSAKEIIFAIWEYVKGTFTNVLSFLKALVTGDFQGMKDAISNQLELAKATIVRIWDAVKEYFSVILSTIGKVVLDKFIQIVKYVSTKMNEAKKWVSNKWEEAKAAAISKISAMVSSVIRFFSNIISNVRTKMTDVKNTVMNKWQEAKTAAVTKLTELVSSVLTFFKDIVTTVKTKMTEAVKTVGEKVAEMPGKVLEFASDMLSAGTDLVKGLIKGITNMGKEAIGAITGVVDGVINKAKSLLKIKSPSRVFRSMGEFVSEGAAIGIADKAKLAINSVSDMASSLIDAFAPQLVMADVQIAPMDSFSQMEALKSQIEQELQVDMTVSHRGGMSGASGLVESETKQPVVINVHVGSKQIASEIVDDISQLQDRSANRRKRTPRK